MKFNYYDSCLLTAICLTAGNKNGTDLKGIISYIDYLDHSIITWHEVSSGLSKLKKIGAVTERNQHLFLSGKFNKWWTRTYLNKKNISAVKRVDEVNEYLDKTYSATQGNHKAVKIKFSEEDFNAALKEYKQLSAYINI